ncbi:MAG: SMP-30/gluconolactonase/LRE family protein, partial [Candidatus Eisenbacteria sp.]|nr:SMP-30/gluconolactonase/LRE family protein [Candidatus Eisenbacteria bacterium]
NFPHTTLVARAEPVEVPFDSERWVQLDAGTTNHLGRPALMGTAYLPDVGFTDGIIEVDIAVTGGRSYPGIVFRMDATGNYERFYLRPHRAGLYPDALQYTPVFNRIAGWQLYNGEGFTAEGTFREGEWFRLRLEINGTQARVFLNGEPTPALEIYELQHGIRQGAIGLMGPRDGSAHFSNFSYETTSDLEFRPPPPEDHPAGMITDWSISQPLAYSQIDLESHIDEQELPELEWRRVQSESSGLVDLARHYARTSREPNCILAKTSLHADHPRRFELQFRYSDFVSVFCNGRLMFVGDSRYQGRDPSFLGVVGLHDAVYLPLVPGENELLLIVTESFGGWGFMGRDGEALHVAESLALRWETSADFLLPESVAYDPGQDVFYVSNYDAYNRAGAPGAQYVSKISPSGEILDLRWVRGLFNPTGITVAGTRLYVVEREQVAVIDTETGETLERIAVTEPGFLNDVACDAKGTIYVSDSRGGRILRLREGKVEVWVADGAIGGANGILLDEDRLVVAANADHALRSIDCESGKITTIARLPLGTIDGIQLDGAGNYIVSQTEGRLYLVTPRGEIEKLLDTSGPPVGAADFVFVPGSGLLVIPTFTQDRVVAYHLEG